MRPSNRIRIQILKTVAGILVISGLAYFSMRDSEQYPGIERNPLFLFAPETREIALPDSEKLAFPGDHGIHRHSGTEVWQVIGHLETADGALFGFEVRVLRVDLGTDLRLRRSAWATDQVFHLSYAITPFRGGEIYRGRDTSRGAMDLSGYDPEQRKIWIYNRELRFYESAPGFPRMELWIPDGGYPLRLELSAAKPVVIPTMPALFRYYAMTRMKVRGTLEIPGNRQPVSGEASFEHSWGRIPRGAGQLVRNRLLLQLSNGIDLNLLQSRRRDGTGKAVNSGFLVFPEGKTLSFEPGDLMIDPTGHWRSEASGIRYPVEWRVLIPDQALDLHLNPWMDDQEAGDFPIGWSGMLSVSGYSGEHPITGFGHVQLSGYSAVNRN